MVIIAPAVHYSALATLPPEQTLSRSQQSLKHTTNIRFKLNRIFNRFLNNDQTNTIEIDKHVQLPSKSDFWQSETIMKENNNNTSLHVKNPNNNNSDHRTANEPFERLPFSEPYFSVSPKNDKLPHFELSAYHKHCIHQQKYIDQKQYHPGSTFIKQRKISQLNSSISSSIKEHRSDLTSCGFQNLNEQYQMKLNNKKSNSSTTLSASSSSIENHIGLPYASRKTNGINIRSSCVSQRLRRLHSKSKIRPIQPSTISSSIAHRIELLKQAMHNSHLEFYQCKSEKTSPIESSTHPLIDPINKETQTNNNQLKASEIHHVHHHHIHSSSFLSIEWRTYLTIFSIFIIILLLLIEIITISF
ncbi:unnamed protein product [Adineta steineri]|uniref:Uncharacterized protein n=1 Tax=Adineta steineri TaxID=433720 RepID=A0A816D867_9BILA|nr:unnamed protein product [Adineta steineri]CAF1630860.1 unnamed protein product [Adineta steineri]